MRAISVRQPWAWMIIHAGKNIENRSWYTNIRGRVLIHAAKGMTRTEWENAVYDAQTICGIPTDVLKDGCEFDQLQCGGIIGSVEIVGCVKGKHSCWHAAGQWGFVLRDPKPMPFVPWKGQLGFFEVPTEALAVPT